MFSWAKFTEYFYNTRVAGLGELLSNEKFRLYGIPYISHMFFSTCINKCNDIIIGAEMRLQHAPSITFGVTVYNVRVLLLSLTVELSVWSCRVLLARLALDGSASVLVVGIIIVTLYYLFTCYQHN